ncbi:MAG: HD domain-containing protein [Cyclobacteriaceae bacterium]|nr:HD domain-containing protein [Cyclobacteriaceae bacterium]
MTLTPSILHRVADYAKTRLEENLSPDFLYHNLSHTTAVVEAVTHIAEKESLSNQDTLVVTAAAWFHDLGYTQHAADHEQRGAQLAKEFLQEQEVDAHTIRRVMACILSTHYPQRPANKLEKVLCDADMAHLGTKEFTTVADLLRQEWVITRKQTYTDTDWYQLNIDFLVSHSFHTRYGRKKLEKRKQKNIRRLQNSLEETAASTSGSIVKGAETLFKNASRNHMELSAMADNKAHILLSISSLIVSVILSVAVQRVSEETFFLLPTAVLLLVCLTTMTIAVMTTRPKVTSGISTVEQIKAHNTNLLFFGNFHKMELPMYEWGLRELLQDKDYMYTTMTRDIYFLGKVLAAKYRLLNIGYRVFMYGLILSVAAFGLAILFKTLA